ncbi:unnamed protein product [Mytilus coruscus]|uniref:Ig-like domain-containing protein n=1 Tax=Mytilus coruscus TaxID=42192 RepID=A0A6J8BXI7_MYTCO|nr:unnamed protein product [Mytilus coruscus]
MQCKWQSEFVNETKWTLNGKEVNQSERTKTTATRGNYNVDTVEIFLIDKNDYGTYQFWISGNSTRNVVRKDSKIMFKDMIALMVLTEKDEIVNHLNVPVGNVLILDYQINFSFKTKVVGCKYKEETTTVISTIIRFIIRLEDSTGDECPSDAYDYEYDVLIVSTENDKDFITEIQL